MRRPRGKWEPQKNSLLERANVTWSQLQHNSTRLLKLLNTVQTNPVLIDYIELLAESHFRSLQKTRTILVENSKRQCWAAAVLGRGSAALLKVLRFISNFIGSKHRGREDVSWSLSRNKSKLHKQIKKLGFEWGFDILIKTARIDTKTWSIHTRDR